MKEEEETQRVCVTEDGTKVTLSWLINLFMISFSVTPSSLLKLRHVLVVVLASEV